jgi:hypothetical protein
MSALHVAQPYDRHKMIDWNGRQSLSETRGNMPYHSAGRHNEKDPTEMAGSSGDGVVCR